MKNNEHIFFNTGKQIICLRLADIMFIESKHPYVHIFCTDDVWGLRMSLTQLQKKLPPRLFVRIHRSYLVSIAHITLYKDRIVHLGNIELPVQNGKVRQFKKALNIINTQYY
jgi:DNA-binding LytR/AlgR family response regulator